MAENSRLVWWPALAVAAGEGDVSAKALMSRFQYRPEEELYRVDEDPYEQNNLAGNPEYRDIKKILRAEVEGWMLEQGDPGVELDK